MDSNIVKVFEDNIEELIEAVISNSSNKEKIAKIKLRLVAINGEKMIQASEYRGEKIYHHNYLKEELIEKVKEWFNGSFKQMQMQTKNKQISVLISKKGKTTIKEKKNIREKEINIEHNKTKNYILKEGQIVPFLVDLGIMTKEGKIVNSKYDKFKQINRYLEFIEDVLEYLPKERELTIIDFGCGKSYLTFAMYYYLKELKGYDIKIIGLDLKEDVINKCNNLAEIYGYDKLSFLQGDIANYEGRNSVDMVVTLHACDTATDYALYKAIKWGASVILSVPCCQHELNKQMENEIFHNQWKYGLIKERTAALFTDALRANLLEMQGYKTQILEFIDTVHTPKNILIRAVKSKKQDNHKEMEKEFEETRKFLNVTPTLYTLLNKEKKEN